MTILDYALYVAGALLTISAAGAVLCKWVKKAISAAIHEDMEISQNKMNKKLDEVQKKLNDEMAVLKDHLTEYIEKQDETNDQMKSALLASTRDRINQAHDYYTKKKFIGAHSLFIVEELFAAYRKLGGNSFIIRQMDDIRELEVRSAETTNSQNFEHSK